MGWTQQAAHRVGALPRERCPLLPAGTVPTSPSPLLWLPREGPPFPKVFPGSRETSSRWLRQFLWPERADITGARGGPGGRRGLGSGRQLTGGAVTRLMSASEAASSSLFYIVHCLSRTTTPHKDPFMCCPQAAPAHSRHLGDTGTPARACRANPWRFRALTPGELSPFFWEGLWGFLRVPSSGGLGAHSLVQGRLPGLALPGGAPAGVTCPPGFH